MNKRNLIEQAFDKAVAKDNAKYWCNLCDKELPDSLDCADCRLKASGMKKLYIVYTPKGFGKAYSLKQAKQFYEDNNGKLTLPYGIHTFEVMDAKDVSIDLFQFFTSGHAKHITSEVIEKKKQRAVCNLCERDVDMDIMECTDCMSTDIGIIT